MSNNSNGGYDAKGRLDFDPATGLCTVNGHDSSDPRNDVKVEFPLADTGYVRDYLGSDDETPENDAVFYPNVTKFLGDLASSGSIVLLHDNSTDEGRRIDVEVQFDLRSQSSA